MASDSSTNLTRPRRRARRGYGAVLVALVVVVYLPTLRNGFITEDDLYVQNNLALRSTQGLYDLWFKFGTMEQYYPLVHTTFWLDYHLWGLNPAGYHAVNMLLHAAAVLLLWRLLALARRARRVAGGGHFCRPSG